MLSAGLLFRALALALVSGRPKSRTFFTREPSGIRITGSMSVAQHHTPSRTSTCRDVEDRRAGGGGHLQLPRGAHRRLPQAVARPSTGGAASWNHPFAIGRVQATESKFSHIRQASNGTPEGVIK